MKKLCSLSEAMQQVRDGMCVGLGGNTLNRAPMAAVFAMIRQGRRQLRIVKTAGGMDVDALCLAGCASVVDAGFISYESQYGLAQCYRKSVQNGLVKANEHACYTVISALRAASYGIPFMPVRGLKRSDLPYGLMWQWCTRSLPTNGETPCLKARSMRTCFYRARPKA